MLKLCVTLLVPLQDHCKASSCCHGPQKCPLSRHWSQHMEFKRTEKWYYFYHIFTEPVDKVSNTVILQTMIQGKCHMLYIYVYGIHDIPIIEFLSSCCEFHDNLWLCLSELEISPARICHSWLSSYFPYGIFLLRPYLEDISYLLRTVKLNLCKTPPFYIHNQQLLLRIIHNSNHF